MIGPSLLEIAITLGLPIIVAAVWTFVHARRGIYRPAAAVITTLVTAGLVTLVALCAAFGYALFSPNGDTIDFFTITILSFGAGVSVFLVGILPSWLTYLIVDRLFHRSARRPAKVDSSISANKPAQPESGNPYQSPNE